MVWREMHADFSKINMFFRKHQSRARMEFSSDLRGITCTVIHGPLLSHGELLKGKKPKHLNTVMLILSNRSAVKSTKV